MVKRLFIGRICLRVFFGKLSSRCSMMLLDRIRVNFVLRMMVHDYAGHPFQVALSRCLAARGHEVAHAYFAGDPGPKGALAPRGADDPVRFLGVGIDRRLRQGRARRRGIAATSAYGRAAARAVAAFRPEVVVSGNTPTAAQGHVIRACRRGGGGLRALGAGFLQRGGDAAARAAARAGGRGGRRGLPGDGAAAVPGERRDRGDHRGLPRRWPRRGRARRSPRSRTGGRWTRSGRGRATTASRGSSGSRTGSTSSTRARSGLKHDPSLLIALAEAVRGRARVVVVGQGSGMAALAAAGLENLLLLPLQPVERLREVLATADVAVAVIEPDAGGVLGAVEGAVLSLRRAGGAPRRAGGEPRGAGGAGARLRGWWWSRGAARLSPRRGCG